VDFRLDWSVEAVEDLESIATFIERDSPQYAISVVSDILEAMSLTRDHPKMGRIVPEMDEPTLRERIVHSYRVIYEIQTERILVLTVIHSRRSELALAELRAP
jgi:addiction module RelE/StbE family toxin